MNEMMKQCCGADGKPDFAMMKKFMEHCGKADFSDAELKMMKQFCEELGSPDMTKMKQFMDSCGCQMARSGEKE